MSLTFSQTQGNGSTLMYSIVAEGGYFEEEDIVVELIDVETREETVLTLGVDYTIDSDMVIFDTAPTSDYYVRIRREVDFENTYSTFQRGNDFGKDSLNKSFLKALYQIQQLADGFREAGFYWKQDNNAGNRKLINLADGEEEGDAVTYGQYQNVLGTIETANELLEQAAIDAATAQAAADSAEADANSLSDALDDIDLNNAHRVNTDNPHGVNADDIGYSASDVLSKLLTVDGSGSGVDADKIDGIESDRLLGLSDSSYGTTGDPDLADVGVILTDHSNTPYSGVWWLIQTIQSHSDSDVRAQIAYKTDSKSRVFFRQKDGTSWTDWVSMHNTVTNKGAKDTTGTWTINNVWPNVPLYITAHTTSSTTSIGGVEYRVTGGATTGSTGSSNAHWNLTHSGTEGQGTSHSCIIIPTSTTVTIAIDDISTGVVLTAYQ
jgi:hypothetical protein